MRWFVCWYVCVLIHMYDEFVCWQQIAISVWCSGLNCRTCVLVGKKIGCMYEIGDVSAEICHCILSRLTGSPILLWIRTPQEVGLGNRSKIMMNLLGFFYKNWYLEQIISCTVFVNSEFHLTFSFFQLSVLSESGFVRVTCGLIKFLCEPCLLRSF